MKATKKIKQVKSAQEDVSDIQWIQVANARQSASSEDITVSFTARGNKKLCYVRIGSDITKQLNWKEGDTIGIYHDPDDIYHWMICKSSSGYRLGREGEANKLRLSFPWSKSGINYTKSRIVDSKIHKDKISFKVPLEVT